MSAQVPADLSEATVHEIANSRDEPDWLRETRLKALKAMDDLEMPDVIQTPGRRWTNLDQLDFDELADPLNQADDTERVTDEGVEVLPSPRRWRSTLSSCRPSSAPSSIRRRTT